MPAAARINDLHICPTINPDGSPHVGGPITGPGITTVLIGSLFAAVVGDLCTCVGPPDTISKGSATVKIGGMAAARVGDPTVHGGSISIGDFTVLIGG